VKYKVSVKFNRLICVQTLWSLDPEYFDNKTFQHQSSHAKESGQFGSSAEVCHRHPVIVLFDHDYRVGS